MKPAIKLFLLIAVILAGGPLRADAAPAPPSNQLANGVGVVLSGAADSRQFFTIDATTQIYNLVVTLSGGTGDPDLYLRLGAQPVPSASDKTGGTFDQRSWETGTAESIAITTPAIGTHHVLVHGWYENGAFTNVTLRATWSTTPPTGPIEGTVALSSITRHGVTWKFDRDYTTGQYANGDFWVVGPIVITEITPTPTTGRNGTVVNPVRGRSQGFDDRAYSGSYNDSLNVGKKLPLTVATNSSVVSSISRIETDPHLQMETYAVLTVVDSVPAAGSFRPPYNGNGSRASLWTTANLKYNVLKSLDSAAMTSKPDITTVSGYFEKVWYEQDLTWTGRVLHTSYMAFNGYGKVMANRTGDAALLLNLDYTNAQKETLLIRLVQYGIDIYGILEKGGRWYDTGGHNPGRFSPLLIAAATLDDPLLKNYCDGSRMKFSEFCQTFFVSQEDVDRPRYTADGRKRLPYTSADIGMPEWGETHDDNPSRDANNWDAPYRDICGSQLTGTAMAARVMGLRATVNWEPLFQYAERHLNYEQSAGYGGEFNSNPTPAFHRQFYNTHHTQF